MKEDPTIVVIHDEDMLWCIHTKLTDRTEYGQPVIELSWGWTAGMTEEEISQLGDDVPKGHHTLSVMLSEAIRVRDELTKLIEKACNH